MRLVSLRVRHYRLHRERRIEFDPSLNLIGGPNETGKSTLVEAAHRALFLSHRRTGQDLAAMRSHQGGEPPEIELVFEQHGRPYRLLKRFNGSRGHAELMRLDTAERWQSNEAELALAAVLGYAEPVSSKQVQSHWAHLWIRQGESGVDPTGRIEREHDALLERLQAQGGTAVMQSALDARLAERFHNAVEQTFTAKTGAARAGSPLKQAETALQSARQRLETCQARTEALATARHDHAQALQRRAEAAESIPRLEARITELRLRLDEAQCLAQQGSELKRALDETTRRYDDLVTVDAKLRALTETAQAPDAPHRPNTESDEPPIAADTHASQETAVVEAEARAFQPNATILEWISGSGPVTLDGQPLQPGTPRLITTVSELRIGDNHFRLQPQAVQETESAHRASEHTDSAEDSAAQAARLAAAALQTLLELHGDETQRRTRIADAQREKNRLEQEMRDLDERLAALQPDRLNAKLAGHQHSLATQQDALDAAKQRIAATLALLQRDGATDPYADQREAQADLERAEETHSIQQRRAKAMQRLAELFHDEQQRLSERFTEPLIGKIGDYLDCLFGSEGRAALKLQDGAFQGLELIRPAGPFPFEVLSGGTREQLAAAVRLAIAEVLAENHGGSLPLVFDDAFANSDPDRVRSLHRMLELAARRGLQVIILTCNPADYATLGARTVLL